MKPLLQAIDDLRRQGEEALELVDVNELRNWQRHPATVYILKQLEADYLQHHLMWEDGQFTAESDSGTAQANAAALGTLKALNMVAESFDTIDALKVRDIEEVLE